MIKVIIIDDRVIRQEKILSEKSLNLKNLSNLQNVSGGEKCGKLLDEIHSSRFDFIDEFNTICIHRSALTSKARNEIISYLSESNKKLIFFSGGISGSEYSFLKGLDFLLIDVENFYSENLIYFLENNAENILEIAFGENWQLSLLLDTLEKIIFYTRSYSEKPFVIFKNDLNLNNWVISKFFPNVSDKDMIQKSCLDEFIKGLRNEINNAML
jgi:hypothetical protein